MINPVKRNFLSGSILIIAAALFLILNITSGVLFKSLRLDLTQNKIYTLSSGSKQIINQLPEPVILRFYFSKRLAKANPYLLSFASRIQDLLTQYERSGKGKIILEVIDPEPFSAEEDNAVNFGLRGIPVDGTGTELYMGLVATNALNIRSVIPFFQPNREENLEYDLSQILYNLSHPEPNVVGVMSALPLQGTKESRPWAVWQQMAQQYVLKSVDTNASVIPDTIKTLMIVEPAHFSSVTIKAIDNFIMRGGNLLAFIDPYSDVAAQKTRATNPALNELLKSWGIELQENKVVADRSIAKSVNLRQADGRESTIQYPFWLDCTVKNFDKKDVLTSSLDKMTIPSPGSIIKTAGAETTVSPLITTSKDAMLVDAQNIGEYQQNFSKFHTNYKPTGAYVLAARISGPINSPFNQNIRSATSNIVVIADADMLHDHFWLNIQKVMGKDIGVPTAANGNFVLSAIDNLSGSNALISIRNRGTFVRPFETIKSLQTDAC